MERISLNIALCAGLALVSVLANAREYVNAPSRSNSHSSFKTEAGDCVTSTAQFDIDINNVRARLLSGGDLWWNLSEAKYEVPKSNGTGVSINAIFAGAIWISGFDAGGNLKCAAQRYRASGDDYWPGPLANGVVDKATCSKYDRFFNVYGANIALAQTAYQSKGTGTTISDIPKDVLSWPAKGNPYLLTDPSLIGQTFDIPDNLAPFKDVDGDGIYDPVKGDYPVIPCRNGEAKAFADQMVFWVFNDNGNLHTESAGQAIGVQINALAFAFQTTDDINNMTFYKYEIVNKSSNRLFQTYISQWVDPDLGCFSDDRVGCDVSRSLGVVYNGNSPDDLHCSNGVGSYGAQLPMLGVDFFEGPLSDSGQQLGMSSFVYFNNSGIFATSDPSTAAGYRNYQTGFWNDGTPFTYGGTGYNSGGPRTPYIFPGNPSDGTQWSECSVSSILPPADRRFVETSGPFTLKPGVSQYVTVGCVFIRPTGGVGLCPDFNRTIGPADDKAQQLFNTCFKLLDGPDAPTLGIRELSNEVVINFLNLPASNNFGESYDQVDGATLSGVLQELGGHGDSTYTFEGYKFYQVANPKVSATDLNDPEKAILIAEVDVKNGITIAPTYVKDATLGILVPDWDVNKSLQGGADAGILSSYDIKEDKFAAGSNKQLVNHQTYYYTCVAFAYNNYKPYDPIGGTGQKTTYLQGRGNFKIYSAIPHIPDPRNTGTILNAKYGDGVEVSRIEGQGNGGNNVQLTPESISQILSSGNYAFVDTLRYQKGFDPIGFQITDPVNLKEADFELHFYDPTAATTIGATTRWFLHDITDNDTIWSDRSLDRPYQQQVMLTKNNQQVDYGFSIKLGTPTPLYVIPGDYLSSNVNAPNRYVYSADANKSTIEYEHPTQQWLSFVKDEGQNDVSNWIRSGTISNNPASMNPTAAAEAGVFDDNWYYTGSFSATPPAWPNFKFDDSLQIYDKLLDGKWAPYCLTANYSNPSATGVAPPYVYGPGFKWRYYGTQAPPQNTLDRVASVDIVITPDQNLWSKCIVFETGEDPAINLGSAISPNHANARKGQIRMAISKVLNGTHLEDDRSATPDTGRSYFPGYAINVETGERLNIAFGESSNMSDQNGQDMLWNPSPNVYSPILFPNQLITQLPFFGGKHFIYVMDTKYDGGDSAQRVLLDNYANIQNTQGGKVPAALIPLYQDLMWTSIPYLTPGYSFVGDGTSTPAYIPPAEIKIKLRVEKPYDRLATISTVDGADSLPRYLFSTKGLGATEGNQQVAKTALDLIKIVPNPYLAYSAYETDQNSNVVKIINLPNRCTITIYSLDGTLIRTLTRAIDVDPATNRKVELSSGVTSDQVNVESSIDWDLKNDKSIPIASGIYLFHIEAPGLGQKTLKWFGAVRPADTSNF